MWSRPGHLPPRDAAPDGCPGVVRVHAAADGGLARIRLPGGRLSVDHLRALSAATAELGDGSLELTSRGNVQVRGLATGSEHELAKRLHAAGLLPSPMHERVRNIIATPLSGRDGAGKCDIRPLVLELDRRLCADPVLAELPGRFLFTVDDGRGDVSGLRGDVGLWAVRDETFALLLAGADSGLRIAATTTEAASTEATGAALAAARAFLDERAAQGSTAWRLAELDDAIERVGARVGANATGAGAAQPPPARPPLGLIPQRDGRVAISLVVPLGRVMAAQSTVLGAAARTGADEIIVTPWRTAVVPDLAPRDAARWVRDLADAGLPADADSTWVGVTACAGRPGCAKALADVRTDASTVHTGANHTSASIDLPVHWVGCERRCGRPAGRHVEVLATADGYEVRLDGHLRSTPSSLAETVDTVRQERIP